MCDPVSSAVVGAGALVGVNYLEGQRRAANQAAREQQASITSALNVHKPGISLPSPPLLAEPLKAATESSQAASQAAARRQLLTRGLMSTFTRYTPSTSGKAQKLGGT